MSDPSKEADRTIDPIRRLGLARRVARQLSDLAEDVLVEVAGEAARMVLPNSLASDFLVTSYDLEIRVSLLVSGEVDSSPSPEEHLERAQALLDLYPDTDAVVLVVGDAELTSVIVEPFDREVALRLDAGAADGRSRARRGPLRELVQAYLRDMSPVWSAFAALPLVESTDMAQLASTAAQDALAASKHEAVRVPEKRAAQAQLSSGHAEFVAHLCVAVVQGEADPASRIAEWVETR